MRLHRIDENASAEVAPLLARLRELQRRREFAVLLVHHARKGAAYARPGQALRGSSEFHAWSDSSLYLRRNSDRLTLSIEHRAAPSTTGIGVELRECGRALSLQLVESNEPRAEPARRDHGDRVVEAFGDDDAWLTVAQIAERCPMRTQRLYRVLADLVRDGRVVRGDLGYRAVSNTP